MLFGYDNVVYKFNGLLQNCIMLLIFALLYEYFRDEDIVLWLDISLLSTSTWVQSTAPQKEFIKKFCLNTLDADDKEFELQPLSLSFKIFSAFLVDSNVKKITQ